MYQADMSKEPTTGARREVGAFGTEAAESSGVIDAQLRTGVLNVAMV
jgi:hypothetical protein